MIITPRDKCVGCALCADICPRNCIHMEYDKFGFYVPIVNEKQCIDCKKCANMCPSNYDVDRKAITQVYKGYARDIMSEDNQRSTSGAIFAVLANAIIDSDGVVFGVVFDPDFSNVSHIACFTKKQLDDCRGSKYIQSQSQGIYKKVEEQLKQDKAVLFSGTPCQIAALKSYFKVMPDNLYTVDFVCHGVGSTKFFQEYLRQKAGSARISHIGFRDKCGCYVKSKFRLLDSDGNLLEEHTSYDENFGKAFANNLISRESCGTCKYASTERVSDISLADNIIFVSEYEKKYGSSFVFINSQKGERLFSTIKSNVVSERLELELTIPRIMHLNHPASPHKDREKLLKLLAKGQYEKAIGCISNYQVKDSPKKKIKKKIKWVYRKFIKS